jgi:S1-C subfamily serine protease
MTRALGCVCLLLFATCSLAQKDATTALFEVSTTYQDYDPFQPWQQTQPAVRSGYAVSLGEGRLLVPETLVRSARLVELRRARTGERVCAQVVIKDPQLNLALIETRAEGLKDMAAVAFGDTVRCGTQVQIVQLNETSDRQTGNGTILNAGMTDFTDPPCSMLTYAILTDLNVTGDGAMVLENDRLVGLMVSYDFSSRTGRMIPIQIIKRFVEDAAVPPYSGTTLAGMAWSELVDPVKREYLGVSKEQGGVLIASCFPQSGASDVLRAGDVMIALDGHSIDNIGYYNDPDFGRIELSNLIKGRHVPGDVVPISVLRGGVETNLMLRLDRHRDEADLIPEELDGARPSYLVEGGFVIRELSGRYLRAHGAYWEQNMDARLSYLYHTRRNIPDHPGDRIVIVVRVLPDSINVGYQGVDNATLLEANGRPVRNLKDVFDIMKQDGGLTRLRLHGIDVDMVLDKDQLKEANARIADTYGIPRLSYQAEMMPTP